MACCIRLVADFNSTAIRITILPGDTDVTVSIPIINDTISEGEESFDVVLEVSGIGVVLGYPRQAKVTIAGKKNHINRLYKLAMHLAIVWI